VASKVATKNPQPPAADRNLRDAEAIASIIRQLPAICQDLILEERERDSPQTFGECHSPYTRFHTYVCGRKAAAELSATAARSSVAASLLLSSRYGGTCRPVDAMSAVKESNFYFGSDVCSGQDADPAEHHAVNRFRLVLSKRMRLFRLKASRIQI